MNPAFTIGRLTSDHLTVTVLRRSCAECVDCYWDGNWIETEARIVAGSFHGVICENLRSEELDGLKAQMIGLYRNLEGQASLETREGWLNIQIEGDGIGHFVANCEAKDRVSDGNILTFSLQFDQTDIHEIVRDLESILEQFPVVGSSEK